MCKESIGSTDRTKILASRKDVQIQYKKDGPWYRYCNNKILWKMKLKYIIISSSETSEQTGKHVTCKKSSEISSSGNGVQSSSRLTMQKAEQSIQFIMRLSCAVYTAYHSMRLTSVDSSSGDGAEQCRQLIRRWGLNSVDSLSGDEAEQCRQLIRWWGLNSVDSLSGDEAEQCRQLVRRWGWTVYTARQ